VFAHIVPVNEFSKFVSQFRRGIVDGEAEVVIRDGLQDIQQFLDGSRPRFVDARRGKQRDRDVVERTSGAFRTPLDVLEAPFDEIRFRSRAEDDAVCHLAGHRSVCGPSAAMSTRTASLRCANWNGSPSKSIVSPSRSRSIVTVVSRSSSTVAGVRPIE